MTSASFSSGHASCRGGGIGSPSWRGAVLYSVMEGDIGAGFHLLGHAMAFALSDNRQVAEDIANFHDLDVPSAVGFGHYFSDPSPCGDGSSMKWGLECYFAPLSSCGTDPSDFSRSVYDPAARARLQRWDVEAVLMRQDDYVFSEGDSSVRDNVRAAWASFRDVQQRHGWNTVQRFIPARYRHRGRLWFKAHVLWFIMQPSVFVFEAVRKTRIELGFDRLGPNARVVAMHVRRGNKATDPNMKDRRAEVEAADKTSAGQVRKSCADPRRYEFSPG